MGKVYQLQREQWIPCAPEDVFAFFADARNLETLTPPWLNFRILTAMPVEMRRGAQIRYQIAWRRLRMQWKTEIAEWLPDRCFVDVQTAGPYRSWRHTHTFAEERGGTRMRDSVRYEMPFGIFGVLAHRLRVQRDLERIFDYRAARIAAIFAVKPQPRCEAQ